MQPDLIRGAKPSCHGTQQHPGARACDHDRCRDRDDICAATTAQSSALVSSLARSAVWVWWPRPTRCAQSSLQPSVDWLVPCSKTMSAVQRDPFGQVSRREVRLLTNVTALLTSGALWSRRSSSSRLRAYAQSSRPHVAQRVRYAGPAVYAKCRVRFDVRHAVAVARAS